MQFQKLVLYVTIGVLIISVLLSLRGITVIGEPQTWVYKYGWPSLIIIVCFAVVVAFLSRKNYKKLSRWIIRLAVALLVVNSVISSIFT